ncbi:MAG: hypothetical protein K6C09_09590, partial [Oscillospiraceae bacterium]|nr:hypothetical protein [Oscillospiraceae bacterium]
HYILKNAEKEYARAQKNRKKPQPSLRRLTEKPSCDTFHLVEYADECGLILFFLWPFRQFPLVFLQICRRAYNPYFCE